MQYKYNHGYRYNHLARSGGAFYNRKIRTIKGSVYLETTFEAKPHVKKYSPAAIAISLTMTADIQGSLNAGTIAARLILTGELKRKRRLAGNMTSAVDLLVGKAHFKYHATGSARSVLNLLLTLRSGYEPIYPRLWTEEFQVGMEAITRVIDTTITEYHISHSIIDYPVTVQCNEYMTDVESAVYIINLEVDGMAIAGSTITLKGTFPDSAGDLLQLQDVTLKIYGPGKVLLETIVPEKLSTGVYAGDYTIPEDKTGDFDYEFSGKLGDRMIVGRSSFDSHWR